MPLTINNIQVELYSNPPLITFLQGCDMSVPNIRDTLRQVEESDYAKDYAGAVSSKGTAKGWIVEASGNFPFSDVESTALTVAILSPFAMAFQAGAIPFQTSAGNLVGTFVNSPGAIVQINNAVGATNLQSEDVQYASFNGGVTVDVLNQTGLAKPGTVFPAGTQRQPVDNFTDALAIAGARGFFTFYVISDCTVDSANDYSNYRFTGAGQNLTQMTLAAAANFFNASFEEAQINGTLDGDSHINNCIVDTLTFVSGVIQNCILNSVTITLGGSQTAHFINCASGVPGSGTPIIDLGGSGQPLAMRNYNGGIELRNKTGPESVTIDLASGQVIIDNTVTNGVIVLRGVGKWANKATYTGGATVVDELLDARDVQEMHQDRGLDASNPKTITEVTPGESYNEAAGTVAKQVRKVGTVTTITRQ